MLVQATRLKILRSKYLLSLHGPKIWKSNDKVVGRSKIWEANPLVPKTNNMPCQQIRFHLPSIIIQERSKGLYQKGTNNMAVVTNISSTTFTAFSFLLLCDYFSPVNISSNSFVSIQQMYVIHDHSQGSILLAFSQFFSFPLDLLQSENRCLT